VVDKQAFTLRITLLGEKECNLCRVRLMSHELDRWVKMLVAKSLSKEVQSGRT
jgi:hypothetical protein